MKHHLKTAIKILFLVIVAGIVYYHFRLSPVSVQTAIPKQQDLMDTVFGTGTLEAKTVVSISPRSTGQLVELLDSLWNYLLTKEIMSRQDRRSARWLRTI